jgi:hypothetical protein
VRCRASSPASPLGNMNIYLPPLRQSRAATADRSVNVEGCSYTASGSIVPAHIIPLPGGQHPAPRPSRGAPAPYHFTPSSSPLPSPPPARSDRPASCPPPACPTAGPLARLATVWLTLAVPAPAGAPRLGIPEAATWAQFVSILQASQIYVSVQTRQVRASNRPITKSWWGRGRGEGGGRQRAAGGRAGRQRAAGGKRAMAAPSSAGAAAPGSSRQSRCTSHAWYNPPQASARQAALTGGALCLVRCCWGPQAPTGLMRGNLLPAGADEAAAARDGRG